MTKTLLTVVETPEFLRRAKTIGINHEERAAIVDLLAADP